MWNFETEASYAEGLAWVDRFVTEEIEPIDHLIHDPYDLRDPVRAALLPPLQMIVKEKGLWGCHLGPELGGAGFGQLKLALLNELLGRSRCAPMAFGAQAPDSGNAEILAAYGSAELKAKYLAPLLDGAVFSCFSMTEPQAGADPLMLETTATQDGDDWVITGDKWFSTNAKHASFFIVMAKTDPDAAPHERMTMFVVASDTPGITILRNVGLAGSTHAPTHAYVRYASVRVPASNMLGPRGQAFAVAQKRLGGGRIHHAMRTVGLARKALDMMCERALSRETAGELLGRKQLVQEMIAESWIDLEQFRLLVLQTAWRIDREQDYQQVRGDIAAVKVAMPRVLNQIASRALQIHGALGVSTEMPFIEMISTAHVLGIADGPTEVHKVVVARSVLSRCKPTVGLFPSGHLPTLRAAARERYASTLAAVQEAATTADEVHA